MIKPPTLFSLVAVAFAHLLKGELPQATEMGSTADRKKQNRHIDVPPSASEAALTLVGESSVPTSRMKIAEVHVRY